MAFRNAQLSLALRCYQIFDQRDNDTFSIAFRPYPKIQEKVAL
jgi:hypothetical protein